MNLYVTLLAVPMLQAKTHSYVLYVVATVFAQSDAAAIIYFTTQLLVACVMQQRRFYRVKKGSKKLEIADLV